MQKITKYPIVSTEKFLSLYKKHLYVARATFRNVLRHTKLLSRIYQSFFRIRLSFHVHFIKIYAINPRFWVFRVSNVILGRHYALVVFVIIIALTNNYSVLDEGGTDNFTFLTVNRRWRHVNRRWRHEICRITGR